MIMVFRLSVMVWFFGIVWCSLVSSIMWWEECMLLVRLIVFRFNFYC